MFRSTHLRAPLLGAVVILISSLALTGCATTKGVPRVGADHVPPVHFNPTKISDVPGKINVVKEVHHKRKPEFGKPNQTEGTYIALAPKGSTVTNGTADGKRVPPEPAAAAPQPTAGYVLAASYRQNENEVVLPDLLINSGWLYVTGDLPCIGSDCLLVESEGCRVVLQCFNTYQRVWFLEGATNQIVNVSRRPYFSGTTSNVQLVNGQFVDAFIQNGHVDHFGAAQTITQAMLDELNSTIDPPRNEDGQP